MPDISSLFPLAYSCLLMAFVFMPRSESRKTPSVKMSCCNMKDKDLRHTSRHPSTCGNKTKMKIKTK